MPDAATQTEQQARLEAVKQYLRVDFDDDDFITALMAAADGYLVGAGISRTPQAAARYDLIVCDMVLQLYDGRGSTNPAQAATAPLVRYMINQLKLEQGYGGDADG